MSLSGEAFQSSEPEKPAISDEMLLVKKLQSPATQETAFQKLIQTYQEMLYWHIRRIVGSHDDADDVLQNTFIKAWKGIARFRGDSQLKTWLYRIATNESLTFVKQRSKRSYTDVENIENELTHSGAQDTTMDGEMIRAKLDEAVATLPEKQRIVFTMKYFDEMKYDEIAEVLGGTVGSLKASFHHAVKKIEKMLSED